MGHMPPPPLRAVKTTKRVYRNKNRSLFSAREEVRLVFLEFKKFEISEERRVAKVDADIARAEQADLDEIGVTKHNRKNR